MLKAFSTVRWIMLGVFALAVVAIWSYQFLYAIPKERCEKAGMWWASRWRACAAPLPITKLTGRAIPRPVEPGDAPAPVQAPAPGAVPLAQPAAK